MPPEVSPCAAFPLARLRLCGVVDAPVAFPEFAGATLRGAFGHALRSQVCITGQDDCRACPFWRSCVYPKIFQPPPPDERPNRQPPVPYIIQPPRPGAFEWRAGESFEFGLVLVGSALDHVALLLLSWRKALGRLGKGGRLRLTHVLDEQGQCVFDAPTGRLEPFAHRLPIPAVPAGLDALTLDFVTPLSFMRDGRDLPAAAWTPSDLLLALARRTAALHESHAGARLDVDFTALKQAASTIHGEADWRPLHWARRSSTQQRRIPLQGVLGQWQLSGALAPFWPYLYLGQWLHAGKKASHGLGRYALQLTDTSRAMID